MVHGAGGLDELSLSGESVVAQVKGNHVTQSIIRPEDAGLVLSQDALSGGDADLNAGILESIFAGDHGPQRDIVLLNAAAVLQVAGVAHSTREGVRAAMQSIDSGNVTNLLKALREEAR